MSEVKVQIVRLPALRVASVHGFGRQPETEAWEKLAAWAKSRGYFDDPNNHHIFGFNNPNPTPASPNYGYEFWITVGPEVEPDGEVEIKHFGGGLYAVMHCQVHDQPFETIPAGWKKLVLWRENSRYKDAHHQCLEKHIRVAGTQADSFDLELYLPIRE